LGRNPITFVVGTATRDRYQVIDGLEHFPKREVADIESAAPMEEELLREQLGDQSFRGWKDRPGARIAVNNPSPLNAEILWRKV
jgi:hypothetical protein